jgi:hypothetical protein
MSQEAVERFLGRVMTDERFRDRARSSFEKSCFSEGYALSKAETEYLKTIDFELFGLVSTTLNGAIIRH